MPDTRCYRNSYPHNIAEPPFKRRRLSGEKQSTATLDVSDMLPPHPFVTVGYHQHRNGGSAGDGLYERRRTS